MPVFAVILKKSIFLLFFYFFSWMFWSFEFQCCVRTDGEGKSGLFL